MWRQIIRKIFGLDRCQHTNITRQRQIWEVEDLLGVGILTTKYKIVWHCNNCVKHGSYWE